MSIKVRLAKLESNRPRVPPLVVFYEEVNGPSSEQQAQIDAAKTAERKVIEIVFVDPDTLTDEELDAYRV